MPLIDQTTINEVLRRTRILDICKEFIPELKPQGDLWVAESPKVKDKTLSFQIDTVRNNFTDSSAKKEGDVVKFLMVYEKRTFPAAIKFLAKKLGIKVRFKTVDPFSADATQENELLIKLMEFASDKFESWLWNKKQEGSIILDYLSLKGYTHEVLRTFRIGASPSGFNSLYKVAKEVTEFKPYFLEKAGLLNRKLKATSGTHYRDFFINRIIFPVTDSSGHVIGMIGSLIDNEKKIENYRLDKYKFSRDTRIFKKEGAFFGLSQAIPYIIKEGFCYVVKDYFDVMALHQSGIRNVITRVRGPFSKKHIDVIKKYTNNFIIVLESNAPMRKAIRWGIDLLLTAEGKLKIVVLPDNKTVTDLGMSQPAEINPHLEKQKDYIDFKIETLIMNETDHVKRAKAIKSTTRTIWYIENPIIREVHLKKLMNMSGISEESLKSIILQIETEKQRQQDDLNKRIARTENQSNPTANARAPLTIEKEFLKILLRHGRRSMKSGINIVDFALKNLQDLEIPILDDGDNLLCMALAKLRMEGNVADIQNVKIKFPSAYPLASELTKDKFSIKELLPTRSTNKDLRDLMNTIKIDVLQSNIKEVKDRLILLENEKEEREKFESIKASLQKTLSQYTTTYSNLVGKHQGLGT